MQRGELLSRVTNDIDNIAQSMQQVAEPAVGRRLLTIARCARDDVHGSRRSWR
jgi:ABC-type transport system involved in cytochrome bd biosynthesis fused ATPase/permease subunit